MACDLDLWVINIVGIVIETSEEYRCSILSMFIGIRLYNKKKKRLKA